MTPTFDKVHNKFKLNAITYGYHDLTDIGYSLVKEGEPYGKVIGRFLLDWMDDKDHIIVMTSGSTGRPKPIKIKKQAMVNSAIATGDFFNLKPGDKALMCLPADYIAGKMMLIRGLILGLELDVVQPSLNPEINTNKVYDFCAMLPAQLCNSIAAIDNFKTIIVGGAAISNELLDKIQSAKPKIFETYGMTESITHI
ncbi:MAG: AMP-binding protein, partial [Bacteroidia bacterium]|nr:AMP-binding protein [Bacteroidia bacterium]